MKNFSAIICFIIIIIGFNIFPYSYLCFKNPINGCTDVDFWWNLPREWGNYIGINWPGYLFLNFVVILVASKVYGKLQQ